MTPEGLGAMTTIIDWLIKRPDSADFRAPLDWQGLGLNDYPKVIEKPMDLATVKQNLNLKRYRTIHNCADDIRLIWSNCKKYNGEGSVYYSLADSLSKIFEEYFDVARFGPCIIKTEKRARDADLTEASKKMRKSINDVAADLVCPITQELPIDPVMAEDGKIYERNAIVEWLGRERTSPVTRAHMGRRIIPALQTKNTISTLIKSGAIEGEIAEAWQKKLADEKRVKECRAKAEAGDGHAMYRLGTCYQFGFRSLAEDMAQARAWYERSAATRDPKGLAAFGECLLGGHGGPKNTALGFVYSTDAAHLGSDMGAFKLGKAFFKGKHGLPKDPVQARFWLKKIVDGECKFKNLTEESLAKVAMWLRTSRMNGGVR